MKTDEHRSSRQAQSQLRLLFQKSEYFFLPDQLFVLSFLHQANEQWKQYIQLPNQLLHAE